MKTLGPLLIPTACVGIHVRTLSCIILIIKIISQKEQSNSRKERGEVTPMVPGNYVPISHFMYT